MPQLTARVLREVLAGDVPDDALELADELLQVGGVEVEVAAGALRGLRLVEGVLEPFAGHVEHGPAEHLHQPAVGVPGETLAAGVPGQPVDRLVVQPDVQDRLHHSGHRELRPRPDRHQQRVVRLAQQAPGPRLECGQVCLDLLGELDRLGARGEELPAGLGRDDEARRHRKPEIGHLGKVGALASQEVLLVLVALGEVANVRRHIDPLVIKHRLQPGSMPYDAPPPQEQDRTKGFSAPAVITAPWSSGTCAGRGTTRRPAPARWWGSPAVRGGGPPDAAAG